MNGTGRRIVALVAVILLCSAGNRPLPLDAESVPFAVDLLPLQPPGRGRELEVSLLVGGGLLGTGAVAHVHMSTSEGLEIAGGDSSYAVPLLGLPPMHRIRLISRSLGKHVVWARGTVIQEGKERGVAEIALAVEVAGDSIAARAQNSYRTEFLMDDQRYRVSGVWLVPIENPEEIDPADVLADPIAPTVVKRGTARCPHCPQSFSSLRVVVVVDRSSAVRYVGAIDRVPIPAAEDSARAAVAKWKFTPGHVGHTPVTDCLVVTVPFAQ